MATISSSLLFKLLINNNFLFLIVIHMALYKKKSNIYLFRESKASDFIYCCHSIAADLIM